MTIKKAASKIDPCLRLSYLLPGRKHWSPRVLKHLMRQEAYRQAYKDMTGHEYPTSSKDDL